MMLHYLASSVRTARHINSTALRFTRSNLQQHRIHSGGVTRVHRATLFQNSQTLHQRALQSTSSSTSNSIENEEDGLTRDSATKIATKGPLAAAETPEVPDTRDTIIRIAKLARPEAALIGASMGTLVVTSGISLVFPYALGQILDLSIADASGKSLNAVAAGLLGLFTLQGGMIVARSAMLSIAGERIVARFRKQLFSSILGQDIAFFDTNRSGDLINRLSADTQLVQKAATSNAVQGLRAVFMTLGGTAMLVYTSPTLALVSLSVIPPVAIGARYFGRHVKAVQGQIQDALAQTTTVAEEVISNMRTVRQFAAEPREAAKYDARIDFAFLRACEAGLASAWFDGAVHFAANCSIVAVLGYGGSLVISHELTAGALTSFLMYSLYVGFNVSSLSTVYSDTMRAVGASSRIFGIVDRVPSMPSSITSPLAFPVPAVKYDPSSISSSDDFIRLTSKVPFGNSIMNRVRRSAPGLEAHSCETPADLYVVGGLAESDRVQGLVTPKITGHVTLQNVSFEYPTRMNDPILQDFSLDIPAGRSIALVGASGTGKSTVGSLITRLYDPTQGAIYLDGVDIKTMDPHWLRTHVGVVPQEPALFATTIRENILYGNSGASDAQVREAAEAAGAMGFINSFPDGLDTLVGERGVALSGGQRQRIAIARAILKDPPVVVLDEATSNLDAESEHHVQRAVERMMKGRTVISIAHRLNTMKASSLIAHLEDGKVAEIGTYDELMSKGEEGKFFQLVHRQTEQDAVVV